MTFGEPGKEGARVHDLKDVESILDVFRAHGHDEVSHAAHTSRVLIYLSNCRLIPLGVTVEERARNISARLTGKSAALSSKLSCIPTQYACYFVEHNIDTNSEF